MSPFRLPFKRRRDGLILVQLDDHQRGALSQLLDQVGTLAAGGHESSWRLSPPTFSDPADQAEYQLGMSGGYTDSTEATVTLFADTEKLVVNSKTLDAPEVDLLLAGLNKLRLVLGTICEVDDEGGISDPDDESKLTIFSYYQFATAIMASLLDAIAS